MRDKKYSMLVAIGISLIIALVICIYNHYSGKNISLEMFGLQNEMTNQQINISNQEKQKSKEDIENVFLDLISSYNNKDLDLLKTVDYRYFQNEKTQTGENYVKAINNCNSFELHKVMTKNITTNSINGYIIYSYKINNDDTIHYVLSEYTIKSKDGRLVITYLNTISSNYSEMEKYLNE